MSENAPILFFLGANSPQGFVSRFDQLDYGEENWHTFIIKGGPGCGKSSLMKRIASLFESRSPKMEKILCSSDPHSLDAIILPEWRISIADGTAPHVLEPTYPGLSESIINLGEFLNPLKLKPHAAAIKQLRQATSKNYAQATDCLVAAKTFLNDFNRITLSYCDFEKLSAYAKHFACKNFPVKKNISRCHAKERVRFLSSINSHGITSVFDTVPSLCPNICFICDEYDAVAPLFLSALRSHALDAGYDVISCYCPISPHNKIEHLLIPELGIALMTENRFHDLSCITPERRIHAKRFLQTDALRRHKKRLSFYQKAASQLIEQAVQILSENKEMHDLLEQLYLKAMDFSMMDDVIENLVAQIVDFKLAEENNHLF